MLILLWGLANERPLALVAQQLQKRGLRTVCVDQRELMDIEIEWTPGDEMHGVLRLRDETIDLGSVTAVYARPYDSRALPAVLKAGTQSLVSQHAVALDDAMASWTEITPALVVNRLSAMASNGSKPYQLDIIRQYGFRVPDTLITTDPDAAQDFWEHHGTVIYKSIGGTRSIVSRLGPEHRGRLGDITYCPTQFQQYIPGIDHRAHVVGSDVFVSQVSTPAVDYRYPGSHPVSITGTTVPDEIAEKCRRLAAGLCLSVAGVDLRRCPDGEWYCFEVNPSPAFTYYEAATGQEISLAISALLANGSVPGSSTDRVG